MRGVNCMGLVNAMFVMCWLSAQEPNHLCGDARMFALYIQRCLCLCARGACLHCGPIKLCDCRLCSDSCVVFLAAGLPQQPLCCNRCVWGEGGSFASVCVDGCMCVCSLSVLQQCQGCGRSAKIGVSRVLRADVGH